MIWPFTRLRALERENAELKRKLAAGGKAAQENFRARKREMTNRLRAEIGQNA